MATDVLVHVLVLVVVRVRGMNDPSSTRVEDVYEDEDAHDDDKGHPFLRGYCFRLGFRPFFRRENGENAGVTRRLMDLCRRRTGGTVRHKSIKQRSYGPFSPFAAGKKGETRVRC